MTQSRPIPPAAWVALFLLALIWGASFLSARIALDEMPVFTVVAFRVGGAAAALWAVVLFRRLPLGLGPRALAGLALMGLFNNVLPFTLITWGQQHIASGLAAILNASTALFGTLLAALVFADERLTARKALGTGLGFAGVVTIVGPGMLSGLDPASLGQWALLGAALSYGIAACLGRALLRGIAPLVAAAGMLTASTLVMVPLALAEDGLPLGPWSAETLAAVAYLALVASALAYLLYYRILALAGAGTLSLVTLLLTPVAILLGALVLGERLPPLAWPGFGLLAARLLVLDGRLRLGRKAKGPDIAARPPELS